MYTLTDLSAGYTDHQVLKGVSLTVHDNSLFSLIGSNGSGKTTLLRVLAGLLSYTGSAALSSSELRSIPRRVFSRTVAFCMSARSFHPASAFTVREIISMSRLPYMGMFSRLSSRDNDIISRSAEILGISHLLSRSILTISDGQWQLVLIASALAQDTRTILLDEPTSSLDPDKSAQVWALLRKLADEGRCIIAAVHDINASMPYSHGYFALKDGVLISHGSRLSGQVLRDLYGAEFAEYHSTEGNDELWRALPK